MRRKVVYSRLCFVNEREPSYKLYDLLIKQKGDLSINVSLRQPWWANSKISFSIQVKIAAFWFVIRYLILCIERQRHQFILVSPIYDVIIACSYQVMTSSFYVLTNTCNHYPMFLPIYSLVILCLSHIYMKSQFRIPFIAVQLHHSQHLRLMISIPLPPTDIWWPHHYSFLLLLCNISIQGYFYKQEASSLPVFLLQNASSSSLLHLQ